MCIWVCTYIYTHLHTHTDLYIISCSHPQGSVPQPNSGAQTESRWWFMFCWNPVLSSSAPPCLHCWAAGSVRRGLLPLAHTSRLLPGTVLSFVQFHSDLDFTVWFTAKSNFKCRKCLYCFAFRYFGCNRQWQGVKVQLDQDHLAFGAVVQHCQATKKIIMMNKGDVGIRWVTEHVTFILMSQNLVLLCHSQI